MPVHITDTVFSMPYELWKRKISLHVLLFHVFACIAYRVPHEDIIPIAISPVVMKIIKFCFFFICIHDS